MALAKILIVDDDPDIRQVLNILLSKQYQVLSAASGNEAVELMQKDRDIDLIILDVMMPGMDGFETCTELRKQTNAPVLFLTAKSAEKDRISSYESGGDDFLSKPFSQAELSAKVNALIRRYLEYRSKRPSALSIENLELDFSLHSIKSSGRDISLTDTEYAILEYLVSNRGRTVTAAELYESVWKERYLPSSGNTVMVHVLNLRRKIEENPSSPKVIRTVWGKGYQID